MPEGYQEEEIYQQPVSMSDAPVSMQELNPEELFNRIRRKLRGEELKFVQYQGEKEGEERWVVNDKKRVMSDYGVENVMLWLEGTLDANMFLSKNALKMINKTIKKIWIDLVLELVANQSVYGIKKTHIAKIRHIVVMNLYNGLLRSEGANEKVYRGKRMMERLGTPIRESTREGKKKWGIF